MLSCAYGMLWDTMKKDLTTGRDFLMHTLPQICRVFVTNKYNSGSFSMFQLWNLCYEIFRDAIATEQTIGTPDSRLKGMYQFSICFILWTEESESARFIANTWGFFMIPASVPGVLLLRRDIPLIWCQNGTHLGPQVSQAWQIIGLLKLSRSQQISAVYHIDLPSLFLVGRSKSPTGGRLPGWTRGISLDENLSTESLIFITVYYIYSMLFLMIFHQVLVTSSSSNLPFC